MKALDELKPGRMITDKELMKNNNGQAMWISIHGRVFDLTEFW